MGGYDGGVDGSACGGLCELPVVVSSRRASPSEVKLLPTLPPSRLLLCGLMTSEPMVGSCKVVVRRLGAEGRPDLRALPVVAAGGGVVDNRVTHVFTRITCRGYTLCSKRACQAW